LVNGFMSRVLADRAPGPVMSVARPGRWQCLGLGAEQQPLGLAEGNGPVLMPVVLASRSATRSSAARVKMTGTAASQVPVSTACGQPAGWTRASGA